LVGPPRVLVVLELSELLHAPARIANPRIVAVNRPSRPTLDGGAPHVAATSSILPAADGGVPDSTAHSLRFSDERGAVGQARTGSHGSRRAMPRYASFLSGFWLLVPGALGLVGLTEFAGDASTAGAQDLGATVISIFAVAIGVLVGTLLLAGATATGRLVQSPLIPGGDGGTRLQRTVTRFGRGRSSGSGDERSGR
jgi:hypothetical protein